MLSHMKTNQKTTNQNQPIYHSNNPLSSYNYQTMLPALKRARFGTFVGSELRRSSEPCLFTYPHLYSQNTEKRFQTSLVTNFVVVRNLASSVKASHYQPKHLIIKTWQSSCQFAN